eukprot:jgi/Picre1/30497/NNA_005861.t1
MPATGGIEITDIEDERAQEEAEKQGVYFVLEQATLEVAKVGKGYDLLNCDDHYSFLKKHGKDPAHIDPISPTTGIVNTQEHSHTARLMKDSWMNTLVSQNIL